jgi:hypothetical protein
LDFKLPFNKLAAIVTGETVYAAMKRPGGGSCLVLSVNLESSDLAFRTAFPILITNALSWFAGQPGELQPSLAAGQLTVLNEAIVTGSDALGAVPKQFPESSSPRRRGPRTQEMDSGLRGNDVG